MPPFDYEAARAKLAEYESRVEPEERRGPTRKYEYPEPEGWSTTLKAKLKNINTTRCGLSNEDLERVRGVSMSPEQVRYHQEHDIIATEDECVVDETEIPILLYLKHGITDIWGEDISKKIQNTVEEATNTFNEHCPPGPPKKQDKRFKDNLIADQAKAAENGWACGVHHIAFRRENGNPHMVPLLSDETISGRHEFGAVDRYMRALTPMKQTIGMLCCIFLPSEYEKLRAMVDHWTENSAFEALVHTEREISTTTVINANINAIPHTDSGDLEKGMTTLHGWGDYDREKGGQLSVPLLGRAYPIFPDTIFLLRSCSFLHLVRLPVEGGQRFSMVHATQGNMMNLGATKLTATKAEASAKMAEAKLDHGVKICPLCQANFPNGTAAVNKHLTAVIKRGGDEKHELDKAKATKEELTKQMAAAGRKRRNKRTADHLEKEEEGHQGDRSEPEAESQNQGEGNKRQKQAAKIPVSNKYEAYGQQLWDEKAKKV